MSLLGGRTSRYLGLRMTGASLSPGRMQLRNAGMISGPKLVDLETRFPQMSEAEQDELTNEVRERMKAPWNEMSPNERQAAYYLAYGPYGPRRIPDSEKPGFYGSVFRGSFVGIVIALGLFWVIRLNAPEAPHTMTKDWQEAANERLKSYNAEPITGISSKNYTGKGQVQSN